MGKYNFENEEAFISYVIDNILTTKEAIAYLDIKQQSFSRALSKGKFKCIKSVGEGRGKAELFLKSDLEPYKKLLETDLKKYNKSITKDD